MAGVSHAKEADSSQALVVEGATSDAGQEAKRLLMFSARIGLAASGAWHTKWLRTVGKLSLESRETGEQVAVAHRAEYIRSLPSNAATTCLRLTSQT
ncbi:hypothetical protein [Dongia deserti]|uniref:hypothetical protein n=1 Tax=Dongia deserti TaxID=2268030 RepID=UPI0013C51656|nr:hypothetical protein [Dongia deserti]